MWSVKTWPKPGDSSIAARTAAGARSSDGCRSNEISGVGLVVIAEPPYSTGRAPLPVHGGPVAADGPHYHLGHLRAQIAMPDKQVPDGRLHDVPGRSSGQRRLAGYSFGDVIAYLGGAASSPLTLPLQQVLGNRLLDPGRLLDQAEVLAQHGGRQDCRGRVGLLRARDVRRTAVHRLKGARRGPLRIDAGAGSQPETPGQRRAKPGQYIAK